MENHEIKITKEEHLFTTEQKLNHLGYGEWVEEVDSLHFEYLEYKCIIFRNFVKEPFAKVETYFGGHLCGYVEIPPNHPYFTQQDIDLVCHGGITFNECGQNHCIGFDCAHSGDRVPSMEKLKKTHPALVEISKIIPIPKGMENHPFFNPVYRNMDYCIEECKSIVHQLLDVEMNDMLQKSEQALKEHEGEV